MKKIFVFLTLFFLVLSTFSFAYGMNSVALGNARFRLGMSNQASNLHTNTYKFSANNLNYVAKNYNAANHGYGREGVLGSYGYGRSNPSTIRFNSKLNNHRSDVGILGSRGYGTFNIKNYQGWNSNRGYGREGSLGVSGFVANNNRGNYMHRYNRRYNNVQVRDSIGPSYRY
jgi:hypothetical protein